MHSASPSKRERGATTDRRNSSQCAQIAVAKPGNNFAMYGPCLVAAHKTMKNVYSCKRWQDATKDGRSPSVSDAFYEINWRGRTALQYNCKMWWQFLLAARLITRSRRLEMLCRSCGMKNTRFKTTSQNFILVQCSFRHEVKRTGNCASALHLSQETIIQVFALFTNKATDFHAKQNKKTPKKPKIGSFSFLARCNARF